MFAFCVRWWYRIGWGWQSLRKWKYCLYICLNMWLCFCFVKIFLKVKKKIVSHENKLHWGFAYIKSFATIFIWSMIISINDMKCTCVLSLYVAFTSILKFIFFVPYNCDEMGNSWYNSVFPPTKLLFPCVCMCVLFISIDIKSGSMLRKHYHGK